MKRKFKGRVRISIIENQIYSNLIFQVAFGNNYAQKIFEIFGKKKSASVISRQLDYLEKKENYLTSEVKEDKKVFPMQKVRIYSVNWKRIIEEFIKEVKKQKESITKENERLNANLNEVFGSRITLLEYLDNKDFIKSISNNTYLEHYLKIYFKKIAQVSRNYTISEALSYILYFGDLDFLHSINSNLKRVVSLLEKQNLEELPKDIVGIPEKDWNKAVNKAEEKEMKERFKKIMDKDFKEIALVYDRAEEIANTDKELKEILILNGIFQLLKFELTLQTSLNETTSEVSNQILKRHFKEEELKRVEQFDFGRLRPKTKEEYENSIKVSKQDKIKEIPSGNSH